MNRKLSRWGRSDKGIEKIITVEKYCVGGNVYVLLEWEISNFRRFPVFLKMQKQGTALKIGQKPPRVMTSRKLVLISLLFFVLGTSSCRNKVSAEASQNSWMGSIVGVNYTKNGIQDFTVDGAWGANLGAYSGGGGFVCCATYPKVWTPGFAVRLKWTRSDGRGPDGNWKIISLERLIQVDKYDAEGDVYVLFLPHDEVRVYVSHVGVGSPAFPNNPGYPKKPTN